MLVEGASAELDADQAEAERILAILLAECSVKQAASLAAQITGRKKNALYERALELKGETGLRTEPNKLRHLGVSAPIDAGARLKQGRRVPGRTDLKRADVTMGALTLGWAVAEDCLVSVARGVGCKKIAEAPHRSRSARSNGHAGGSLPLPLVPFVSGDRVKMAGASAAARARREK